MDAFICSMDKGGSTAERYFVESSYVCLCQRLYTVFGTVSTLLVVVVFTVHTVVSPNMLRVRKD